MGDSEQQKTVWCTLSTFTSLLFLFPFNGSCSPEMFGGSSKFAVLPPGRAMLHVMKVLEPELRQVLETAVSRARHVALGFAG